jgi:hypothetical protein
VTCAGTGEGAAGGLGGPGRLGTFCEDGPVNQTVVFQSRSGRVLTIGAGLLAVVGAVVSVAQDPAQGLRALPAFALVAVAVWAVFGRPAVLVSDGGIEVRNVLRTIELPWPSIERIDTKYALTLYTAYGVYAAWAAPAPSRSRALAAAPGDTRHLPESWYAGGGVRPGDLVGTPSGDAAAYIRRRWEELRDAGHLDAPRLERDRPRVHWHAVPAAGVAVLVALAVLAQRVP